MMFLHMKMVQVNGFNKLKDNRHIRPLWLTTHPKVQVHKFYCEVDTGAGCNIMSLCIYTSIFRDQRPELPMMIITGYGDSLVANTGSCTAVLLTGCHVLRKAIFQVVDTRGYLILGRETVRKIGYMHFLMFTHLRLTQQPKVHTHLKAVRMKTLRHEVATDGKKHRLPIMKEYVLKGYSDVFSGVGTLSGKEYHIILKKNYVLVQHPPKISLSQDQDSI